MVFLELFLKERRGIINLLIPYPLLIMKKRFILSFSCLFLFFADSSLHSIGNDSVFGGKQQKAEPRIFVNNRILATVNGKHISTYDIMKKMDLSFYKEYPQYTSSVDARFQYYQMAWKHVLDEMIDKELIFADAKESKIEVSSGDVRQEMETSFGPNIIANLDKVGMSFDEAADIIEKDILIRRMVAGRVHSKALRQVTPIKIRVLYDEFAGDPANARSTQWSYRVVTIKDRSLEKTEETAQAAYKLLLEGITLDNLLDQLNERKLLARKSNVTVSATIKNNDQELSKEYLEVLSPLDKGMYSQPFSHKSRSTKATVYRIFFVEEKIPGGIPSYKELEPTLKNRLLDKEIDKETELYLQKLRQHYHIRQSDIEAQLPPNYEPFVLK